VTCLLTLPRIRFHLVDQSMNVIGSEHLENKPSFNDINKKFWEEIIGYFPLTRHEPHRIRSHQQFSIAAGTCLLSHCLAMILGYTEAELLYDWRFIANHFVMAPSPLRITARDFFFCMQLYPCGHSPCVTSSLTKWWVSLLWLCLALFQVYVSHI
jgi:hypothetical protein